MHTPVIGTARIFGDNIDTDQIYPGRYLDLTDKKDIAKYCLRDVRENFATREARNSIIIAGKNFGCGSSREHAVITLKEAGVLLVIASSFARIFFRNAVNLGLPVLTCKMAKEIAGEGESLEVDLVSGIIQNHYHNKKFKGEKLPNFIMEILNSGGIKERFRRIYLEK